MTIRVSVVVPTCNRPHMLDRCLAALLAQDFDRSQFEVIVVDDNPSAATRAVVEARVQARPAWQGVETAGHRTTETRVGGVSGMGRLWSARHAGPAGRGRGSPVPAGPSRTAYQEVELPVAHAAGPAFHVRYIPVTRVHGPAAARNVGWKAALGEIIAFTDDDCLPAPGWLKAGVSAFDLASEGEVIGVSGQVVMPLPLQPTDYELNAAGLQRSEFVTANCFYRRAALAAVGGFDENFTAAWREDSDLFFTLLERYEPACHPAAGCAGAADTGALIRAPNAVVFHPIRPASWGVSLRQQRKAMYNALLYKKHPGLYRQRLAPVTPWHYYAILASLVAAAALLLSGQRMLALLPACAWALLTVRFCFARLRHTIHTPQHIVEMALTSALIPPLAVFWRLLGSIKHKVLFL